VASLGLPGRSYDGLWANTDFETLGVHPELVQSLAAQDILRPTVVQAESFAPLVKGKDVILRSETGSGKTLAYLLPLVNRVYHLHDRAREAAQGPDPDAANPLQRSRPWVVLAPTSDLCAQVLAMLEAIDTRRLVCPQSLQRLFKWEALHGVDGFREPRLGERTTLSRTQAGTAVPRASRPYAVASPRIRWGSVDVVVGTPSKFCQVLEQLREDGMYPACVVMDEADALFQGTGRVDLFEIFGLLRPRLKIRQPDEPRRRLPELIPTQFVFAAATMVHIGPFSAGNMLIERFCTAHTVETQHFHRLPVGLDPDRIGWLPGSEDWDRRVDLLLEVLRDTPCNRTLIFVNALHNCHVLFKFLRDAGWPVVSFMKGPQGRMGPRFRDAQRFVQGEATIMIATEFGGRGIDWAEVDHVINFQMPTSAVCWLHRVGRTGRIGRTGRVTNFVAEKDKVLADLIQARLAAGKDLHGAFSRRRSLPRRMRSLRREEEAARGEGADASSYSAEGGRYRLHGGLELFQEGLDASVGGPPATPSSAADGAEGTLIGYLASVREDAEPGVVGRRLRQRAREAAANDAAQPRRGDRASAERAEGNDTLMELRRQFLASDSESEGADADAGLGSDSDSEAEEALGEEGISEEASSQAGRGGFSWKQIEGPGNDAVVGPPSRRDLLARVQHREEPQGSRQYSRPEGPSRGRGQRRVDVRARNRAVAGRHYAEPDDDLLL